MNRANYKKQTAKTGVRLTLTTLTTRYLEKKHNRYKKKKSKLVKSKYYLL